jgi:predicted glutamine amidotransferase
MLSVVGAFADRRELLFRFRELAATGKVSERSKPGHRDGWGIICYEDGMPKYLGRSTADATKDECYVVACDLLAGVKHPGVMMGHLRKASFGDRSIENTQPFLHGKWSFAHNGTIWSTDYRRDNGRSDSVIFFERLLKAVEAGSPILTVEDAITNMVRKARSEMVHNPDEMGRAYSSLTFIMSDGTSLYALRDFANQRDADYYTLHYLRTADAIIFCQERIIEGEWKPIPNKSLASVDSQGCLNVRPCEP